MALTSVSVIDLDTSQPFVSVVHCKQYDTVRMVEAHLFFSGVKWYVPTDNIYAMISYKKSDNIGGFYDVTESGIIAVSVKADDRSVIYLALDAQMLRTPGETRTDVVFYDTITEGRLGLFQFILDVEEAAITEVDLASNPYFNILAEEIKAVLEADAKITGLSADASALKPDAQPTVHVTGGTSASDPYMFHLGIPSMPGMTASATKLAPKASPTATITGGTQPYEDFNIALGIPSMPGMTASASQLDFNKDPTAVITGGTQVGEDFHVAFGIPKAVGIVELSSSYGISMDEEVLPTTWVARLEDLHVPDGSIQWTKNEALCDDGNTYLSYAKCAQGYPGPPGVAVQHEEPNTTVKIWIDPENSPHEYVIPEYTADEDAMIHSFSGVIMTTVETINRQT